MTLLPTVDPPEATNADLTAQAHTELVAAYHDLEAALAILDEAGWSDYPHSRELYDPLCKAADTIEKAIKLLGVAP